MAIEIVEKYVNELIDRSTLEEPVWNIEKIRAGKKASWDYIDGLHDHVFTGIGTR